MKLFAAIVAAAIVAHVINDEEALEPSVLNEVEHALSRVPTFVPGEGCETTNAFRTNGLSATAVAIRLVSLQRGDGRWFVDGTNCTREATRILSAISGTKEEIR